MLVLLNFITFVLAFAVMFSFIIRAVRSKMVKRWLYTDMVKMFRDGHFDKKWVAPPEEQQELIDKTVNYEIQTIKEL